MPSIRPSREDSSGADTRVAQAATAATSIPAITWSDATVPLEEKYRTHGDSATQAPAAKAIHSCHSAKIVSAAIASAAISMPLNQAFQFVRLSAANPKSHGDANKPRPITRLTPHRRSCPFSRQCSWCNSLHWLLSLSFSHDNPPRGRLPRDRLIGRARRRGRKQGSRPPRGLLAVDGDPFHLLLRCW